jgi:hypothetical protein
MKDKVFMPPETGSSGYFPGRRGPIQGLLQRSEIETARAGVPRGSRNRAPDGSQWCEHMARSKITGMGTPSIHKRIPRPIVFPQ